jgi:hypothetical protein
MGAPPLVDVGEGEPNPVLDKSEARSVTRGRLTLRVCTPDIDWNTILIVECNIHGLPNTRQRISSPHTDEIVRFT